jgi:hypothetical protein
MSVMELGHVLTRSGLTHIEVSSEVFHDSFCQLGNSVSLSWVVCHEKSTILLLLLLLLLLTVISVDSTAIMWGRTALAKLPDAIIRDGKWKTYLTHRYIFTS